MRNRKTFFAVQGSIILGFIILNVLIFYMVNCNGEYLQSRDVWGNTQTILKSDLKSRQKLINEFSQNTATAVENIDGILAQIEKNEQLEKEKARKNRYKKENDKEIKTTITIGITEKKENYLVVRNIFSEAEVYGTDIQSIGDKAEKMSETALYSLGWYRNNIVKSERDYYGLNYVNITPMQDEAWNALIDFRVTDLLACGMAVVVAVILFFLLQNQAEGMIFTTGDVVAKGSAILLAGFVGLYGSNLMLKDFYLEQNVFNVSIQSLQSFRDCHYILTVGGFFIIWLLIKLSACLLVFMTILCIVSHSGKKRIFIGMAVLAVVVTEYIFAGYVGEKPLFVFLREINLFSAFTPERFFNRYLNLNIAGNAYSRLTFFMVLWCFVFVTVLLVCVRRIKMYQKLVMADVQKNYDEEINRQYLETRRLWHDFQNHLLAIQAMTENGDREGADRYIKDLSESISTDKLAAKTGYNPVDLLLYKKQVQAAEQEAKIKLVIQCELCGMNFTGYDLCSVIGNLLDNALEAVKAVSSEERIIELNLKRQQGMLFISCKNPYKGEIKTENGRLITSKNDKKNHGIGISSIEQVCQKYQGTMEIQTDNEVFHVLVLLVEDKNCRLSKIE